LELTAALVAGAVVLVVVLVRGGGHGSRAAPPLSVQTFHSVVPPRTGDAAVSHTLRHGQMIVVIDQPSSGMFAEQSASIAQGAAVAVDELNATGGLARHVRVKLVPENLDGLSAAAVQGRLRSEAAAALVLPCDTDSQLSLAAGAARYGTLMLAPCNPDPTAGRRYSTYWPIGTAASEESAGLVSAMRTTGYGSVFILGASGSRYVELLTGDFRAAAERGHLRIVGSAPVATTAGGFASLAGAIKAAYPSPASIFVALPPPLVNQLVAGLRAQGVTQAVMGTSAMDTQLTLTSNRSVLENSVFPSNGFPRESGPAHRFAADYKKRFGGEPVGSFPGLGFETVQFLEAAVRDAHSAEPSAIQRTLSRGLALGGVALAERTYRPGGDHNPVGPVSIEKVSGSTLEPLLALG